jgi:DNA replication protein DnaC
LPKHPTLARLLEPGLDGMAKAFEELAANPESRALEHAEWLGLLVEREATLRQQKRFEARARTARLRHAATIEDVDFRTTRGLDRTLFLRLASVPVATNASVPSRESEHQIKGLVVRPDGTIRRSRDTSCDWIREHRHCLITGKCGTWKSWLACALGDKACRDNLSVLCQRCPRLFAALALARGDGLYARLMRQLAKVDLLNLDDWGPEPLTAGQRRDLLEIVEDRTNARSLIITSQLPVDHWYEIVGNPTLADASLAAMRSERWPPSSESADSPSSALLNRQVSRCPAGQRYASSAAI